MEKIRLQKFLAENDVASRRKCEELIINGKIKVNGLVAQIGAKIDPEKDKVEYNGKIIKNKNKEYTYILLNKPIGVVTTVDDQFNRQTVIDLINIKEKRILPVGRLDMYTSGALILTDDGDFIYKVTHPKHEINKVYNATVKGIISKEDVEKLQKGVMIDNSYITREAKVKILKIDEEKNTSRLEITIHEGKNREVRKMCEAVEKKVLALHRAKIGNISVKDLKIGNWRYLTKEEIESILK